MILELSLTAACALLVMVGAWSLFRLLKERQASDRSYGGENDTGKGWHP